MEEQISEPRALTGPEAAKAQAASESILKRELQALELQRERILSERTSSPVRRAALEAALADIESRINQLG